MKNQYIGGEWRTKGSLGQFADLRGGLAKKRVRKSWDPDAYYELEEPYWYNGLSA